MRSAVSWIKVLLRRNARTAADGQRWFAVELEGANVWTRIDDRPMRVGFFKTVCLAAADERSAADTAMTNVTADLATRTVNDPADPPRLLVEAVTEVAPDDVPDVEPGYVFFPDDEDVAG
jgi:hypothetical protein